MDVDLYLKRIQVAIDYIENNLGRNIGLEDVSQIAAFSPYHFHRVFKSLLGESVNSYICKRQLTQAAAELIDSDNRIIDIALAYQFGSQEAFTRAFKRQYGVTPNGFRKTGSKHILQDKKRLTLDSIEHLAQGITLKPRIEIIPGFYALGLEYRGLNKNGEIPAMWEVFFTRKSEIPDIIDNHISLGICEVVQPFTEESTFSYLAGVKVENQAPIPKGMIKTYIPTQEYAVFSHKDSVASLEETYSYIYGTWLLKSGYELLPSHDFELYDLTRDEILVYIPVKVGPTPVKGIKKYMGEQDQ